MNNVEYRIKDGKSRVYYNDKHVKPGFSFTDAMRKAHDDGSKTETRRLHKKPRFEVGQLVYVKEPLEKTGVDVAMYSFDKAGVYYEDDSYGKRIMPWQWERNRLPGIFMPGIAARHIDRIVSVKRERLQDITEDAVWNEGIECRACWNETTHYTHQISNPGPCDCMGVFIELWDSINPKAPWASNPKVVVYKWEVVV